MAEVLFFVGAIGAIGGAMGVVLLRNPFYSVLALVVHLFALALLFLLLTAEFLAAAQLVVYAGAVMVLYVFVVAYIGGVDDPGPEQSGVVAKVGPLFALVILVELCIAVIGSGLGQLDSGGAEVAAGFGSPGEVGQLLLEKFLVPFEAASFLLLVAAVGAVVLAQRRRGLLDDSEELPDRAPDFNTDPGDGGEGGGYPVEPSTVPDEDEPPPDEDEPEPEPDEPEPVEAR